LIAAIVPVNVIVVSAVPSPAVKLRPVVPPSVSVPWPLLTRFGEPVIAPAVLARMMDHFSTRPPVPPREPPGLAELSEREREVLALIGAGRSNSEIAGELYISMATVKTHVRHVFAKLDLRDRAQAVVLARDAGLTADR